MSEAILKAEMADSILENSSRAVFSGLNDQQIVAVSSPFDRHCLVLAGAGCGKTSVLTRRIAHCAETFCEQQRICALTFTHKAADEMKTRLRAIPTIQSGKAFPFATTFHGFGLHVVRDTVGRITNASRLGFSAEPRLLTSEERLKILAEISSHEQRRALGVDILGLDRILARQEVGGGIKDIHGSDSDGVLETIAGAYAKRKRALNVWEFADMLIQTVVLFEKFPDVKEYYARFFRHILVDEFQDTNPLQIRLLRFLLSGGTKVFAVGDDDQAIYGFRGADTEPTLHFTRHFESAHILKLETNYRSRPAILRAANKIFTKKNETYRKVLRSGKYSSSLAERGAKPCRKIFDTQEKMITWIIAQQRKLSLRNDIAIAQMCMLFRINETLDWARNEYALQTRSAQPEPIIMTVHGSKGLEFPVVFLCDLEESVFPSYRRKTGERIRTWFDLVKKLLFKKRKTQVFDVEEEKRLFYVGITRAEHFLFLLSCRSKHHNGRRIAFEPSRFMKFI